VSQSDHNQLRDCRICNTLCLARASGYTALDGFQTDRPDLAILDTNMPRIDGMATLRRLRTHDLRRVGAPFHLRNEFVAVAPAPHLSGRG